MKSKSLVLPTMGRNKALLFFARFFHDKNNSPNTTRQHSCGTSEAEKKEILSHEVY